jgi:hypothetical protein
LTPGSYSSRGYDIVRELASGKRAAIDERENIVQEKLQGTQTDCIEGDYIFTYLINDQTMEESPVIKLLALAVSTKDILSRCMMLQGCYFFYKKKRKRRRRKRNFLFSKF